MKTIAILYGGKSGEHEVSLRSGGSVYSHLDRSLYEPILIAVDHEGKWYLQQNPGFEEDNKTLTVERIEVSIVSVIPGLGLYCRNKKLKIDIVFPVLHGTFGEDGTLQGLLEITGIPFAGAGVLGSALGMDKAMAKQIWLQSGLPVVPFITVRAGSGSNNEDTFKQVVEKFGFPLFVKPANAGSSVGVSKVNSLDELKAGVKNGFKYDTKLLIEPAIEGREIECSVIGNMEPVSFLPGEVISDDYYDYDSKYIHPESVNLSVPAVLTDYEISEIKETAEKAFLTSEAEGFARVDFFIEKGTGKVLINEINTLPGFTEISMFAKLCDASGLSYKDMLTKIIQLAEERYNRRNKLIYKKE
ncbi:MAG: D-alanine--D-alanine ligase [Spirochaetales bacterium]|nr:D-alanine--D-alanine ligase [Spirochaetales bacterium]